MEMNAGEKELHHLEDELHVQIIPGTEIMTDVGDLHFVKTGNGAGRVLVPQPSNDPHDPLNWSPFWKTAAGTCATWTTFTQGYGPLSLAAIFGDLIMAFHCTLAEAIQFTGISILVLGFSNFLWVPLSTSFGRRPVMIFSQLINIGAAIWRARAQTYGSFMGACVLNGFASGPGESIQPQVVADVFFLHDRGTWNGLYWVTYMGGLMVGPVIAGAMAARYGFRSFWWFYTACLCLSFIMNVFLFPETRFHRKHPEEITGNQHNTLGSSSRDTELAHSTPADSKNQAMHVDTIQSDETFEHTDSWLGRGKPSKAQWKLWQPSDAPFKHFLTELIVPWQMLTYPIPLFASFVVSWSCSVFLALNLTQVEVFAAPPYLWNSQSIGFTNLAILAGALIGLATAGPFSDWVSMRATVKNNGVREPEMRLPALIPYVLVMILGNIITAVGYQQKWRWEPIVIIGYACAGLQVAALPAITSTYAVDSYKPVAGSVFVAITVNKNVWGYGLAKFITPWIEKSGYIPVFMTNMALTTIWCLFGIVFYYYGKRMRGWTKNSKVHRM